MGVNTFLLDRRTAGLFIGGTRQTVGTLRRFFKLTELDEERAAECDAASLIRPSPAAAMVMDISELPLASAPDSPVASHLVMGWDEGRGTVTDLKWDFLPVLGYAIRDPMTQDYTLYEIRDKMLHPMDRSRAHQLELLDRKGSLIRHGQPRITSCEDVRPFLDRYADAECILSTGQKEKLMTRIEGGQLPPADWFVGKTPMQIEQYRPEQLGPGSGQEGPSSGP